MELAEPHVFSQVLLRTTMIKGREATVDTLEYMYAELQCGVATATYVLTLDVLEE